MKCYICLALTPLLQPRPVVLKADAGCCEAQRVAVCAVHEPLVREFLTHNETLVCRYCGTEAARDAIKLEEVTA